MSAPLPPTPARNVKSVRRRRLFIVDDHPIFRSGLEHLFADESDLVVCGQADSARSALDRIARARPDLVLVDISLSDGSGIELTKDLHHRLPALRILVLSMHEESLYAERALRAGARGYMMKDADASRLLAAVRTVLAGGIALSETMSSRMLSECTGTGREGRRSYGIETLSDRELDIFELIGRGFTTKRIAGQLGISVKTVETHRIHVRHKLHVPSANELLHLAVRWVEDRPPR